MARRYTWLVIAGLMVLGIGVVIHVLGLGGATPPAGQESPQAVLTKAHRALVEGDPAKFAECFVAEGHGQQVAVGALFDFVRAAYALEDALRENYGKSAWETFVGAQADPAAFVAPIWPRDPDFPTAAKITVAGNEAKAKLPGRAEALPLRLEGVWRIDAFPRDGTVRERREGLARATDALRKILPAIALGGPTPRSLGRQVREQLATEP